MEKKEKIKKIESLLQTSDKKPYLGYLTKLTSPELTWLMIDIGVKLNEITLASQNV